MNSESVVSFATIRPKSNGCSDFELGSSRLGPGPGQESFAAFKAEPGGVVDQERVRNAKVGVGPST